MKWESFKAYFVRYELPFFCESGATSLCLNIILLVKNLCHNLYYGSSCGFKVVQFVKLSSLYHLEQAMGREILHILSHNRTVNSFFSAY